MAGELGTKEQEIMNFLSERIFDPILESPKASDELRKACATRSCAYRNEMPRE
jgi:hypothetical protein